MNNRNKIIFASELFALVVSMSTIVVGTNLTELVNLYQKPLSSIVLFSSAFAVGRITTCNLTAKIVDKKGPKIMMILGTIFLALYVFGIVTTDNYYLGMLFSYFGGVGQGAQDIVTPCYLAQVSGKNYSRNMSLSQVLYSVGCFLTPFLVSIFLKKGYPYYYSNFIMLVFPLLLLLVAIPIKKVKTKSQIEEEAIIPIHTTNKKLAMVLVGVACMMFTAANTGICTYVTTYGMSVGLSEVSAINILTIFSVGLIAGALVFSAILHKYSIVDVFIFSISVCFVLLIVAITINIQLVYDIIFFAVGFFMGDMFAVIIILSTSIWYDDVAFASSIIAVASGLSDVVFPSPVGRMVENLGASFSMYYVLLSYAICIISAIILKGMIKED